MLVLLSICLQNLISPHPPENNQYIGCWHFTRWCSRDTWIQCLPKTFGKILLSFYCNPLFYGAYRPECGQFPPFYHYYAFKFAHCQSLSLEICGTVREISLARTVSNRDLFHKTFSLQTWNVYILNLQRLGWVLIFYSIWKQVIQVRLL